MSKTNDDEDHQQQSPPPPKTTLLHRITTVDKSLSHKIHTLTTPIIPTIFLKLLEISGDGRLWLPITLSLLLSPLSLHRNSPPLYSLTLSLLAGLISDIIIIGILKQLFRRPRPVHNLHPMGRTLPVDNWSFPSGHASRVCFIAALFDLSESVVRRGIEMDPEIVRRWIGDRETEFIVRVFIGAFWVWAISTSVSRVLLGRHYVFDVVAGSVVGILNAFFIYRFVRF